MLLGDMNARTGTLNDFILNDSGQYLPVANDIYIGDNPEKNRNNQDTQFNDRGKLLMICVYPHNYEF